MIRGAVVVALVLGALSGCSSGGGTAVDTTGVTSAPKPAPSAGWLAVIASSEDPNDLDAVRSGVVTALGDDGARVVVSPGACFTGIAERYATRYVLALAAGSRERVEELVQRVGHDAEWIGPVTPTCID